MQGKEKKDLVVNLSSKALMDLEIELLNKGLNFVSAPGYDPFRTGADLS